MYRLATVIACLLLSNGICKSQTSALPEGTLLQSGVTNRNLQSQIIFVELNCENLFDCIHDEGKDDSQFLPEGDRHWTRTKYWRKLNDVGKTILSCSEELPDLVALIEVENDSVLHDLTRRSLLRNAGYEYLMTSSPDVRGLDVALLYQPASFLPLCYENIEVPPLENMRPTRDILYIKGVTVSYDTLHIFIVHAPSRYGGEHITRPNRIQVTNILRQHLPVTDLTNILVAGDFNDYADDASLCLLEQVGLQNVTKQAKGLHGEARGTYRFQGRWHSLDHVLMSAPLASHVEEAYINDAPFLLEEEGRYGGKKPHRSFNGFHYVGGVSDHLPLVVKISFL